MLVSHLLNRLIRVGSLSVINAYGHTHLFEGSEGPAVTARLHDRALHHRLFTNPSLALGEANTNGTLTVKDADLYDFLDLIGRNMELSGLSHLKGTTGWINWLLRRLQQWNTAGWSRFNAARHYDFSGDLYDLFLDADKQYSCAYFPTPGTGLDEAQEAKKRLIAAKLILEPGHKVLDIGSGWGGMAIYLARETGADVTGLTLSAEQLKVSRQRARDAGLSDRVRFHLRDYRDQTGVFDRIVSVGMFEHVGIDHFGKYFLQVRDLLTADGVALVHTIGRVDGPRSPIPGSANMSSPAAISRRCRKSCRRSSKPGFGPPISRSCGCITPKRCAIGASVSRPTGKRPSSFTTSGSSACGSIIWQSAKSVSAISIPPSSRSRSPGPRTRCR